MPQTNINTRFKGIMNRIREECGTEETRAEAIERLTALTDDLQYLTGERKFEEFVEERLAEYRAQSDKPLCSCWRATCPLKNGEVPPKLRQHGTDITGRRDPSELVVEYLHRHDGGEAVRMARKEWSEMATRVDLELSEIESLLSDDARSQATAGKYLGVETDEQPTEGDV